MCCSNSCSVTEEEKGRLVESTCAICTTGALHHSSWKAVSHQPDVFFRGYEQSLQRNNPSGRHPQLSPAAVVCTTMNSAFVPPCGPSKNDGDDYENLSRSVTRLPSSDSSSTTASLESTNSQPMTPRLIVHGARSRCEGKILELPGGIPDSLLTMMQPREQKLLLGSSHGDNMTVCHMSTDLAGAEKMTTLLPYSRTWRNTATAVETVTRSRSASCNNGSLMKRKSVMKQGNTVPPRAASGFRICVPPNPIISWCKTWLSGRTSGGRHGAATTASPSNGDGKPGTSLMTPQEKEHFLVTPVPVGGGGPAMTTAATQKTNSKWMLTTDFDSKSCLGSRTSLATPTFSMTMSEIPQMVQDNDGSPLPEASNS